MDVPQERLDHIAAMLQRVHHAAVATVNADGLPHNSPLFVALGEDMTVYWSSHPEAQHSQNIERTGKAFVVFYDSVQAGGGLYMECDAEPAEGTDMLVALAAFNKTRTMLGRDGIDIEHFRGPQRLYMATPRLAWINYAERDETGRVVRDNRYLVEMAKGQLKLAKEQKEEA